MVQLRPYQTDLITEVRSAWSAARAVLMVLPTGGGKTVVFSQVIKDHAGCSAVMAHRREIVGQISCALGVMGVKHRVIAPPSVVTSIRKKHLKQFNRSFIDPQAPCGVVSVQTMTSKSSMRDGQLANWVRRLTLCVFDEGHHYVDKGAWAVAVQQVPDACKLLFVTATPQRGDGRGLGRHANGFCDVMVEGPPTHVLIQRGSLSRFRYFAPKTDINLTDIPVTASGEFNSAVLRARTVASHLVGDVFDHFQKFAKGKRALVFASDVATADEIAAVFNAGGVHAESLNGKTETGMRDRHVTAFRDGDLRVLVNVDLFDEGFDAPGVEAVVLARSTHSIGKYLQMVGRALRVMDGKTEAIIIDPVCNWERHGLPDWPRSWTLDDIEKGARAGPSDATPVRICCACTQPYEIFNKVCPYCGTAPRIAVRTSIKQVAGDLTELNVGALNALFAKIDAANMSDEDYRKDQISRRIPEIGRNMDLKRHQNNTQQRKVLEELVAWWCGCQPAGRDMGEIQKRFNHRFGVDIGTAFTLKAKDTLALIECIQLHFTEDLKHGNATA